MRHEVGTKLHPEDRRWVLAAYVHRYTREHVPDWAKRDGRGYPHFADDRDWLAHTRFAVRKDGRLDQRVSNCESTPTWPAGKPLRPQAGAWQATTGAQAP